MCPTKKPRQYHGLPIDRKNYSLLELGEDHPAVVALVTHGECRLLCGCREIQWPDGPPAADQTWKSVIDGRTWQFSSLFYSFISFDLVFQEWIDRPTNATPREEAWLQNIETMRAYVSECEAAAKRDDNQPVLEMVASVNAFADAWENAVRRRWELDVR